MTLQEQINGLVSELRDGLKVGANRLIEILEETEKEVSPKAPAVPTPNQVDRDGVAFTREEGTPIRFRAKNWTASDCKRCLKKGAPDGDIIVRIFGIGWWHDDCYRVVNPGYYKGL